MIYGTEQTISDDHGNKLTLPGAVYATNAEAIGKTFDLIERQKAAAEDLPEDLSITDTFRDGNGAKYSYTVRGKRPYRRNPEYGALRDMIFRKYGSILGYALAVGKNSRTIGRKLLLPGDDQKIKWVEDDIITACQALDIPQEDIGRLFFPYLPTAAELEKRNNQTIEDQEKTLKQ